MRKQALDVVDNVIQQENLRQAQDTNLKSLVRTSLKDEDTINRHIEMFDSEKTLDPCQRVEAKSRLQKLKKPKYKPNASKFEEYYIRNPSKSPVKTIPISYSNQRKVSKHLFKMWNSFTKYNNRLSKCHSFLALKLNSERPKAAEYLLKTLLSIFNHGYTVVSHKMAFFRAIKDNYEGIKYKEHRCAFEIQKRSSQNLKMKWFGEWRRGTEDTRTDYWKADRFLRQNLKMKGFFTLLRYARKRKQMRVREMSDYASADEYAKQRYFNHWLRAYTHKMNQLENRKWFKVKYSDYCKWRQWMQKQIDVDIKPEFDKFTDNPYPKITGMINTSRTEIDRSQFDNIPKSNHPFSKYANPLTRANINPNDDTRDWIRTECTIRTMNQNENSFNPFNKCGVRETLNLTIPNSLQDSRHEFARSGASDNSRLMNNPYLQSPKEELSSK
jgi:hypothetical protein